MVLVAEPPRVERTRLCSGQPSRHRLDILRDAHGLAEITAGAAGQRSQPGVLRHQASIGMKEAVHGLVQGSVAADHGHPRRPRFQRLSDELRGVPGTLGTPDVGLEAVRSKRGQQPGKQSAPRVRLPHAG